MSEHPLVPLVRFYLICVMAMAVTWLWPHWGLILLGVNCFGWWGSCTGGCCGNVCTRCTGAVGNQVQVVITGVANGGGCTACANKNATWTLPFSLTSGLSSCNGFTGGSSGGTCNCFWCYGDTSTAATGCGSCNAGFGLFLWGAVSLTDVVWTLYISEHSGTAYTRPCDFTNTYSSGTSVSASADLCTKWSATSFTRVNAINACCNFAAATATVTEL